jgi:hypothetical protein
MWQKKEYTPSVSKYKQKLIKKFLMYLVQNLYHVQQLLLTHFCLYLRHIEYINDVETISCSPLFKRRANFNLCATFMYWHLIYTRVIFNTTILLLSLLTRTFVCMTKHLFVSQNWSNFFKYKILINIYSLIF